MKNLLGQTVIVTGAATGIGRVCALQFAKLGARVFIGIRGQERAERIAQKLCNESHDGTVIGYDFDLSSLANVKLFAKKIDRVDILLNNAGIVEKSFKLTVDGIENDFGTNHSKYFFLLLLNTNILLYFSWTFLFNSTFITSSNQWSYCQC
jgi:NAD(P)-dependent dehydrogenase (short-subunit alcohol dehydrogenase family)